MQSHFFLDIGMCLGTPSTPHMYAYGIKIILLQSELKYTLLTLTKIYGPCASAVYSSER